MGEYQALRDLKKNGLTKSIDMFIGDHKSIKMPRKVGSTVPV
jgi:hypothetical protein